MTFAKISSTKGLAQLDLVAQRYGTTPSALMLRDRDCPPELRTVLASAYGAFCFDETCAYIGLDTELQAKAAANERNATSRDGANAGDSDQEAARNEVAERYGITHDKTSATIYTTEQGPAISGAIPYIGGAKKIYRIGVVASDNPPDAPASSS